MWSYRLTIEAHKWIIYELPRWARTIQRLSRAVLLSVRYRSPSRRRRRGSSTSRGSFREREREGDGLLSLLRLSLLSIRALAYSARVFLFALSATDPATRNDDFSHTHTYTHVPRCTTRTVLVRTSEDATVVAVTLHRRREPTTLAEMPNLFVW